jgi:hypothetical protein
MAPLPALAFDDGAFATGQQLLTWCEKDRQMASAYVMAFIDTSEHVKGRTIEASKRAPKYSGEYEEFLHRFVGNFCLPKSLTIADVTDLTCKWLKDHPDRLSRRAAGLLPHAYAAAYPCLEE